jgi:histidine triad (HIT) family protein
MSHDCLFCKIAQRTIPATFSHEDELAVAFPDINPQAPIHQIIIPKQHITDLNQLSPEHHSLMGHLLQTAQTLAKKFQIDESGYRIVNNCNAAGGQTIFHLHFHLLGGRQMNWSPG